MTPSAGEGGPEAERLLERITARLPSSESVVPIADADYMRCHIAFEGASDQQTRILQWLEARLTREARPEVSVLSVGAGSGILDVPLIARLARKVHVRYAIVEPIEAQCERFRERIEDETDLADAEVEVFRARLEDFRSSAAFDFVLAIHSLYYVEDVRQAVRRILELRSDRGTAIVAAGPLEELNLLAEMFWRVHQSPVWFAKDVERCLRDLDSPFESHRISASLDVTDLLESRPSDELMDFLIQARFRSLSKETQQLIERYVAAISTWQGSRATVPHPVEMLDVPRHRVP